MYAISFSGVFLDEISTLSQTRIFKQRMSNMMKISHVKIK
jgi:hypothetical protein